jgi:large repetitive protein
LVTTPGGTATLSGAYTYVATPSLTDVSPNEGPSTGGQSVTLTGTNFRSGMPVRFGGTLASLASVHPSGTLATVTTPAHLAGVVAVSVTTPGGSASLPTGYTYVDAPTLTAVAPQVGPTAGGQSVTLMGTGFRTDMQVWFGGDLATLGSVDPAGTSATVTTPAHAAIVVDVAVMTPGGSDTLHGGYTYVVAPTLTAVSPGNGPTAGGTSVTITGTHLSGTTGVTFAGVAATDVMVVNDSTLTATTPAHTADFVDVVVTTAGGSDTLGFAFEYVVAPTLATASPNTGPTAGNTSVTLFGGNIATATTVTFGGVPATNLTPVNDDILVVTTPAQGAGPVDVVVSTAGGQATLVSGYTYVAPPDI